MDITDEEAVEEAIKETVSDFNQVDLLVTNAGISLHKPSTR